MQNKQLKAETAAQQSDDLLPSAPLVANPLLVAVPFVSGTCEGEKCFVCKQDAKHKVGEEISFDEPNKARHNLTSYVCCHHFQMLFGKAANDYCLLYSH